ncbi:DUF6247 family protein [Streptomyces sp. NPDC004111]|uniref:DUF6247 family protein n=1 Tax=Streptomyces sp. NPDC004111 TaxID=3364690 RepID=UPI0036C18CEF
MSVRPERPEDADRADFADRADLGERGEPWGEYGDSRLSTDLAGTDLAGTDRAGTVGAASTVRAGACRAAAPPSVPEPAAAARLLVRIRADRRAARWVPAFERDWDKALEDSRHSYTFTPFHEVVRTWQARLDTAPAVDAFLDSGADESDHIALEDVFGG